MKLFRFAIARERVGDGECTHRDLAAETLPVGIVIIGVVKVALAGKASSTVAGTVNWLLPAGAVHEKPAPEALAELAPAMEKPLMMMVAVGSAPLHVTVKPLAR